MRIWVDADACPAVDQGHPLPRRGAAEDRDDAGGEQGAAHAAVAVHPRAAGAARHRRRGQPHRERARAGRPGRSPPTFRLPPTSSPRAGARSIRAASCIRRRTSRSGSRCATTWTSCAARGSAPADPRRSTTPTASASPTSSTSCCLESRDEVAAPAQFAVRHPGAPALVGERAPRGRLARVAPAADPGRNGGLCGAAVRGDRGLRRRAATEAAWHEARRGDARARARLIGRKLHRLAGGRVSARRLRGDPDQRRGRPGAAARAAWSRWWRASAGKPSGPASSRCASSTRPRVRTGPSAASISPPARSRRTRGPSPRKGTSGCCRRKSWRGCCGQAALSGGLGGWSW